MIRRTLHFAWLPRDSADKPSPFHIACRNRARLLHLDWQYKCWTDDRLIREMPGELGDLARAAWKRFDDHKATRPDGKDCGMMARSDLLRLVILYTVGGVYLDWDVYLLKPLDEFILVNPEIFCGWNSYEPPVVGEHVIGAAAGSLKIEQVIRHLCTQAPDADGKFSPHVARFVLTDPSWLGVEPYPTHAFNPHGRDAVGEERYAIHQDTYAIHAYSSDPSGYDIDRLKSLT